MKKMLIRWEINASYLAATGQSVSFLFAFTLFCSLLLFKNMQIITWTLQAYSVASHNFRIWLLTWTVKNALLPRWIFLEIRAKVCYTFGSNDKTYDIAYTFLNETTYWIHWHFPGISHKTLKSFLIDFHRLSPNYFVQETVHG